MTYLFRKSARFSVNLGVETDNPNDEEIEKGGREDIHGRRTVMMILERQSELVKGQSTSEASSCDEWKYCACCRLDMRPAARWHSQMQFCKAKLAGPSESLSNF